VITRNSVAGTGVSFHLNKKAFYNNHLCKYNSFIVISTTIRKAFTLKNKFIRSVEDCDHV
jgi:hypothetical protein